MDENIFVCHLICQLSYQYMALVFYRELRRMLADDLIMCMKKIYPTY